MPTPPLIPDVVTLGASIAPWWAVLPVALLTLIVTAGHWIALARADMPASRKRLRTANGLVMMLATPVLAYGFGVVDTADQRRFVLTWMLATGLITIVLVLALLDLCATFAIARQAHRQLLTEFALAKAREAASLQAAPAPAPDGRLAQDGKRAEPPGHDHS